MKEFDQYTKLIENKTKLEERVTKAFEVYANENTKWKDDACKGHFDTLKGAYEGIKGKEDEYKTARSEEELVRFKAEFLTHRIKHYNKMCTASASRFRFKQTEPSNTKSSMTPWNLALLQTDGSSKKKGEDDDRATKKGEDSPDSSLCGIKCLTMPKVVYAPYIQTLMDDYIRMQYTFS